MAGGQHRGRHMGLDEALDFDIVLCACKTPPRIMARLAGESWYDDRETEAVSMAPLTDEALAALRAVSPAPSKPAGAKTVVTAVAKTPVAAANTATKPAAATPLPTLNPNLKSLKNLSPGAIDLIKQSPTLVQELNAANSNLTIIYRLAGTGTGYDRQNNQILLDANERGNANEEVQSIAHEMGHATGPARDYSNVDAYVQSRLDSEGAATLNNIAVRNEIMANTPNATDIGIGGSPANQATYEGAYNDWQSGAISKEEAMTRIGNVYGASESPSVDPNPNDNYQQYYRNTAPANLPPSPNP
jgi:type VI secretion system secreted protein VgrG